MKQQQISYYTCLLQSIFFYTKQLIITHEHQLMSKGCRLLFTPCIKMHVKQIYKSEDPCFNQKINLQENH